MKHLSKRFVHDFRIEYRIVSKSGVVLVGGYSDLKDAEKEMAAIVLAITGEAIPVKKRTRERRAVCPSAKKRMAAIEKNLHEKLYPCAQCKGIKRLSLAQVKAGHTCSQCGGSGFRKHARVNTRVAKKTWRDGLEDADMLAILENLEGES